jgi:RNA polymerase sigma-70 factor (ECF subfamily)
LLVRVKAQEREAWYRLVQLYTPMVYSWCRRARLQAADAADVGQVVFKTVWQKINDFHRLGPRDSFRGWLRAITHSKIVDFHRQRLNEVVAQADSEEMTLMEQAPAPELPDPDPETDGAEATLLYHRAITLVRDDFEEKTWLAFRTVVMDGRTPEDAACALDMTVNAVYLAKSHVLKRLREEFGDLIET